MCKLKKDSNAYAYTKLILSEISKATPDKCKTCPLYKKRINIPLGDTYRDSNCECVLTHALDIKRYDHVFSQYKIIDFVKALNNIKQKCILIN